MITVLASNNDSIKVETSCSIGPASLNPFACDKLVIMNNLFSSIKIELETLKIQELDSESFKSFLGSAGVGLIGGVLLGPLGLIAGALAGGNKKRHIFGIEFSHENINFKIVVETTSSEEIRKLQKVSYKQMIA